MSPITALNTYLKPFESFFAMDGVSEVCINRPYEVWVETKNRFQRFEVSTFSPDFLWQFAGLVAEYNQRELSPEHPILSSVLPDGSRVQFVVEPACAKGSFICAIRRVSIKHVPLEAYFKKGDFSHPSSQPSQFPQLPSSTQSTPFSPSLFPTPSHSDERLLNAYLTNDYVLFLKEAVLARKNILISGGTSTGKTTFLNALLEIIPQHERLITIETDREVKCTHPNTVHLLAGDEGKSVANVTMLDLLKASLRLRPDRILVSELRSTEAFPYLRAINSGHPGSLTTLHADSPQGAFEQLAFMALQSGSTLTKMELLEYAKSIIPVVVQIKRDVHGKRSISEVYFDQAEKYQHPRMSHTLNKVKKSRNAQVKELALGAK